MKRNILLITVIILCLGFTSSEKLLLNWNINEFKKLTYKYEQTMQNKSGMFNSETELIGNGNIIVEVKNDSIEIKLTNLTTSTFSIDSVGNKSEIFKNTPMPELVIQSVNNYKKRIKTNQQIDILSKTLFPILESSIELGETTNLPLTMTFNRFDKSIIVEGNNKINFKNKINEISKIETVIEVSKIVNQNDLENICFLKGNSFFDFNSKKGYYTKGVININMSLGTTTSNDMTSQTQIKLELISVE